MTPTLPFEELVANRHGHVLVDTPVPGAPLFITFSFVDWAGNPDYYLYGRLRKLEQLTGQTFNKILLRDSRCDWYQRGVPGLGDDVISATQALQQLMEPLRPSQVITVGESMGGYGATSYGARLKADRILAFGPLSHLRADEAVAYQERRWLPVMERLRDDPPAAGYDLDLCDLLPACGWAGQLSVGFGTDAGTGDHHAVCLDALHAWRLARCAGVNIHPFAAAGHPVTLHLKQAGLFDAFLLRYGLGLAGEATQFETPAELAAAQLGPQTWMQGPAEPGAPLVISFAQGEHFDLTQDLLALRTADGRRLNTLFLRDPQRGWYQRGLAGTAATSEQLLQQLQQLAASLDAPSIRCVGQGMGAYGALLWGIRLQAQRVLALAPVAHRNPDEARRYNDARHLPDHQRLRADGAADTDDDLLCLARQHHWQGHLDLLFGTQADVATHEATRQDAAHAMRLATLPQAHLHPLPQAQADPAGWLKEQGGWRAWLERLVAGC